MTGRLLSLIVTTAVLASVVVGSLVCVGRSTSNGPDRQHAVRASPTTFMVDSGWLVEVRPTRFSGWVTVGCVHEDGDIFDPDRGIEWRGRDVVVLRTDRPRTVEITFGTDGNLVIEDDSSVLQEC